LPWWQVHDCWELSSMMVWILVKQPIMGVDTDEDAEKSPADLDDDEVEDSAEAK